MPEANAPQITVDVFEAASGIPDRLVALGAVVERRRLPEGDYDVGSDTLIERKRVDDLHRAVIAGRFWAQIGGLRAACRYPFLIVEGPDIDAGPLSRAAVRGVCLAATRLGVRLLRTTSTEDSALWIQRLAAPSRANRDRPSDAQRRVARTDSACAEAMLAAVPGISVKTARELLAHFGSVADVFAAAESELVVVRGVGKRRAARVVSAYRYQAASRSELRSERPDPAT